ncbi:transaldolase family protein [Hominifimenecus sp. rT4P-3]|uniref:transaldolase family protein n=1 Tax=Hominifimenecus sp. rT4P-3 TaxID=3242979 RepID=UPI003DA2C0C7
MQLYLKNLAKNLVSGEEAYVKRVMDLPIEREDFDLLDKTAQAIGVTEQFRDVIDTFQTPAGETPAGFQATYQMDEERVLRVDLKRNISYDKNSQLRPTNVLFSADSADPYQVASISNLIANLTCNPGIVYDLFINNPKANVGNKFKNRDEVMAEIARILGPGCDISVELNNPFEEDFGKLLEEAEKFKEMFSKYRVVIKIPHTGVVNRQNMGQLLEGDKKLDVRYDDVNVKDAFLGHNLALKFHEHGYRVNFTLMFEPYQTQLALQARPYFINSFIRHRLIQSQVLKKYVDIYQRSGDVSALEELKEYMMKNDYLTKADMGKDLSSIYKIASNLVAYRHIGDEEGSDGLDGMRHNLRVMKNCNMKDTRLIVCSMEGPQMYPDIDKLLTEPEFMDMNQKVVITAEPEYLARFSSTNQVISYQRRFLNAANGQS